MAHLFLAVKVLNYGGIILPILVEQLMELVTMIIVQEMASLLMEKSMKFVYGMLHVVSIKLRQRKILFLMEMKAA